MQSNKIGINGEDLNFNVSQLLKEYVGATREYDIKLDHYDFPLPVEEGEPVNVFSAVNIEGHVKFTRLSMGLLVTGALALDVHEECSRCLEDSQVHLDITLEDQFRPTIDLHSGQYIRPEEDEMPDEESVEIFQIDGNHTLDLEDAIRQSIFVTLPMQPLCKPDCKGICPHCGQNRNNVQCNCDEETIDPRFSVLQNLLPPEQGNKRMN